MRFLSNKTIFSIKFSPITKKGKKMTPIKNIKPISYIKANAAKVLDHVCETRAPYVVTQNGDSRLRGDDIQQKRGGFFPHSL